MASPNCYRHMKSRFQQLGREYPISTHVPKFGRGNLHVRKRGRVKSLSLLAQPLSPIRRIASTASNTSPSPARRRRRPPSPAISSSSFSAFYFHDHYHWHKSASCRGRKQRTVAQNSLKILVLSVCARLAPANQNHIQYSNVACHCAAREIHANKTNLDHATS
jgi:hypothetical protein